MVKAIFSILIILLLFTGALGYYSYDLSEQITTLNDKLTIQNSEIASLSGKLATFRAQTGTQISNLDDELTDLRGETDTKIGTLDDELTDFKGKTDTRIGTLSGELKDVSGEISQSVINIGELYEEAKSGVVEIYTEESWGSGFVFDSQGYIVTNYHVVKGASTVDVVLHDGTTFKASIVGSCKYNDIAVLKHSGEADFKPLALADSDAVDIGEPVMVIGSPFTLPGTVTSGIISQKGRLIKYTREEPYYVVANLIQYTAASNPGNSGGPLFNSTGDVIGLVSAGVKAEVGEGINFAISSNKVERVVRSIIDTGSFRNPTFPGQWTLVDLTPEEAREKYLGTTDGVLVTEADSYSPFDVDNIIVAIDGVPVRSVADLFSYIGKYGEVGGTVKLTVIDEGAKTEISIKLITGGVVYSDGGYKRK